MSLINDALKRAKQAQKKPPSPPSSDAPLQPAETAPSGGRGAFIVFAGAIVILLLAGWFFWQWWGTRQATRVASAATPATDKPPVAAKSSLASNLTQPFKAVAKLETAINEARQTNALTAPSQAPLATNSAPQRPGVEASTNTSVQSPGAPPSPAPTSNVAGALREKTTNELVALAVSRPVTFPPLRLQGIYFRLSKPSVLINNRTLFLGDTIDGVRVVGIERYAVKVEMKGATNDLFLK